MDTLKLQALDVFSTTVNLKAQVTHGTLKTYNIMYTEKISLPVCPKIES